MPFSLCTVMLSAAAVPATPSLIHANNPWNGVHYIHYTLNVNRVFSFNRVSHYCGERPPIYCRVPPLPFYHIPTAEFPNPHLSTNSATGRLCDVQYPVPVEMMYIFTYPIGYTPEHIVRG